MPKKKLKKVPVGFNKKSLQAVHKSLSSRKRFKARLIALNKQKVGVLPFTKTIRKGLIKIL